MIVFVFLIGSLFVIAIFSFFCAIGWRQRCVEAINSANENAKLWAEAELAAHENQIEVVRYRVEAEIHRRNYESMKRLVNQAIGIQSDIIGLERDEVFTSDRILDADQIE